MSSARNFSRSFSGEGSAIVSITLDGLVAGVIPAFLRSASALSRHRESDGVRPSVTTNLSSLNTVRCLPPSRTSTPSICEID